MSTHQHKTTYDTLSPYTRDSGSSGPTNTLTVEKRFAQRLRGVLRRINAAIRRGVVENDIFNLSEETDTLEVDEPGPFETDESVAMTVQFVKWLREQLNSELLTVVGPDRNQFLRTAYAEGIRNAHRQIRDTDVAFVPDGVDELMGRPIHRSALQELFSRTYSNLQSVRDDMARDVRDTLLEGFQEGVHPREIGKRLTDRVDSIGKHRATMIARSETINAHSTGTLNTAEQINRDTDLEIATGHGEWDSANDLRTCEFCRLLDGTRFKVNEMRNSLVKVQSELPGDETFVGRDFRLKPPAHPNGRCNIRIIVGGTINTPLEERLPNALSLLS